jgi:radical SAM protein with 4Fe4S-binding SPASM domain
MTVTNKNINDISNMVSEFGEMLSFAPLFNAGRAKAINGLSITGKEYYNALSSICCVNPMSYLCSSLETAKKQRIVKCAIGDSEISISESGDVYPCHLLHLPQFLSGHVKEQSLEVIYNTSNRLKLIRELNVLNIKGCKKCDIRFICGGACRARAFFETGEINASDDFCKYEKLAFTNGLFELYHI